MHFEGEFADAVFTGKLRSFLPVGDDTFFPLPILHFRVFGRPAVGNPVGLRVRWGTTGAAGKTYDHFNVETFGKLYGFAKSFRVAGGVFGIRMDGIAVTTESGDVNATILEFFLPGFGFGRVRQEFIEGAMM